MCFAWGKRVKRWGGWRRLWERKWHPLEGNNKSGTSTFLVKPLQLSTGDPPRYALTCHNLKDAITVFSWLGSFVQINKQLGDKTEVQTLLSHFSETTALAQRRSQHLMQPHLAAHDMTDMNGKIALFTLQLSTEQLVGLLYYYIINCSAVFWHLIRPLTHGCVTQTSLPHL